MAKKRIRTKIIAAWRWSGKNVSSVFAALALLVSVATLWTTQSNNERTLRAYVYAAPGNVYNVIDNLTPEPRIVISNSGSTVAKDVKRWAAATLSKIKSSDEINRLGDGRLEDGIMNIPPRVPHAIIRYSEQLKAGQRDQIAKSSGELRLYVYGRIEYVDIFEKARFTNFCFVYYGEQQEWNGGYIYNSTQARFCDGHNDSN